MPPVARAAHSAPGGTGRAGAPGIWPQPDGTNYNHKGPSGTGKTSRTGALLLASGEIATSSFGPGITRNWQRPFGPVTAEKSDRWLPSG